MTELKPCPLCNGEAMPEVTICDSVVRCTQCSCRVSLRNGREGNCREEAIAAWTTRAAPRTDGDEAVKEDMTYFQSIAADMGFQGVLEALEELDRLRRTDGDDGELVERLLVQKTADEMDADELAGADFEYGHAMCVLDGRQAADRITALSAKVAEWKDWYDTYFPMMQKQDMELRMEITRLRNQVEALGAKT